MKVMISYSEPGGLRYVKLDKDIVVIEAEKVVNNEMKLKEVLAKQRERDNTVLGVVVADNVLIKLHNTMKFSGVIWSTRAKLSGKYEFI